MELPDFFVLFQKQSLKHDYIHLQLCVNILFSFAKQDLKLSTVLPIISLFQQSIMYCSVVFIWLQDCSSKGQRDSLTIGKSSSVNVVTGFSLLESQMELRFFPNTFLQKFCSNCIFISFALSVFSRFFQLVIQSVDNNLMLINQNQMLSPSLLNNKLWFTDDVHRTY